MFKYLLETYSCKEWYIKYKLARVFPILLSYFSFINIKLCKKCLFAKVREVKSALTNLFKSWGVMTPCSPQGNPLG